MKLHSAVALTAIISSAIFVPGARAEDQRFILAEAIPNDVLFYAAGRHNPESQFVYTYWEEVIDTAWNSGVGEDLIGLLGSMLGDETASEVQRIRARATKLVSAIDWNQIGHGEMVFAERLARPTQVSETGVYFGPPDMVWLLRAAGPGVDKNFTGLGAILDALVDEINKAASGDAMTVERKSSGGVESVGVNLLAYAPGAPRLALSVTKREGLLIIALGDGLRDDVVGLLDKSSTKMPLLKDPRFLNAYKGLPQAEDSITFFSMAGLIEPMRDLSNMVTMRIGGPRDTYDNVAMTSDASKHHEAAMAAYSRGDYKAALENSQKAYAEGEGNCIVLYNLACFNALNGNALEAMEWLETAVAAGFYAPNKIAMDSDLSILREDPRFEAAVKEAARLARGQAVDDVIINSSKDGEAYKLVMQTYQACEQKDLDRAAQLAQQAQEVAPKDPRVLYATCCVNSLRGNRKRALDYLDRAIERGYYCPSHIASDSDLNTVRPTAKFKVALAKSRAKAVEMSHSGSDQKLALAQGMIDRVLGAVGVMDYAATVEYTDGFDVHLHSVAALVPDAEKHPIHAVFGNRPALTRFDRYLPMETQSFSTSSGFDPNAAYGFLEDTLREAGPKGQELLNEWAAVQERIGLNVSKDIFSWMDGQYHSITMEDQSWVLMLKVTDEKLARQKMGATIDLLLKKLSEAAAEIPQIAMLGIRRSDVDHARLSGYESLHFAMSPMPVVWGVADGHMTIGSSPNAILKCLDTAAGKHPSIRENSRAMAEVLAPPGPFSAVSLTDQRNMGKNLATMLGMASMIGGSMSMAIPDPDARTAIMKITGMVAKLAPAASKIDFFKSTASHSAFDGAAWRMHAVTHYYSPEEHAKIRGGTAQ